jgi:hypothetical protein
VAIIGDLFCVCIEIHGSLLRSKVSVLCYNSPQFDSNLYMYIQSTFSHPILVKFVLILFSCLHLCLPFKNLYEHFIVPNDEKREFFSFQVKRPERECIDYTHTSRGCCLLPPAFYPRFDGGNLIIQCFKVHILTLFELTKNKLGNKIHDV